MPYPSLPGHRPPESFRPSAPSPSVPPRLAPPSPSPTESPPVKQAVKRHSAKIYSWDSLKGYGFLNYRKKRLFLHHRDFAEHHKKPKQGDLIHFELGQDSQGRKCAVRAIQHNDGGSLTLSVIALLATLLILPYLALYRLYATYPGFTPWILNALLLVNVIGYFQYASDKKRARSKDWRIPESTLHFLELIGGWPGAYIAQHQLRHKCSKGSYQNIFWFIIILHQMIALDYYRGFEISTSILKALTESTLFVTFS